MTDKTTPSIDARGIVRRHGGPFKLFLKMAERGFTGGQRAVQKWRDRNSIPSKWLAVVLAIPDESGKIINLQEEHIHDIVEQAAG